MLRPQPCAARGRRAARWQCSARASGTPPCPVPSATPWVKSTDVVALGNLCVDVFLELPQLPASSPQLLERLTAAPPDRSSWEVGGNCNFLIAASRLGMKVGGMVGGGYVSVGRGA